MNPQNNNQKQMKQYESIIESSSSSSSSDSEETEEEELRLLSSLFSIEQRFPVVRLQNYVESLVAAYNEKQFQENFRVTRNAFDCVLRDIAEHCIDVDGNHQISIKKQLLATIWILATPDSFRSVAQRFGISKSTLCMCFIRIINAISKITGKHIKWPLGADLVRTKNKFGSSSPFKELVGVIDGTYVRMKAPKAQHRSYINRKCYTSMTLQCICDSEMRYIDCYAGWPSSVPDIRVFKNSDIYLRCQKNEKEFFPNGEYILGDKAYPCNSWCIPPFIRRRPLTDEQKIFNKKHASARVIVENSFALLFGRFPRLRDLDMKRIDWIPSTILACCVLHNVCLNFNEQNTDQYIAEGQTVLENNNFNQDPRDYERESKNYQNKRNMLCNEISNLN